MARITLPPLLKWRDGRPRWEPSPARRRQGWKGRDLKGPDGSWLGLDDAIAEATRINAEVAGHHADGRVRAPRRTRQAPDRRSFSALCDLYRASPAWGDLAPRTRQHYDSRLGILRQMFGPHLVAAITKPQMYAYYERQRSARGLAMAYSLVRVASLLFSYAERIGWRTENTNPCARLGMKTPPGRLAMWEPEEVAAVVEAADAMGEHAIGTAFVLAIHSGQRQGDILAMDCRLFDPAERQRLVRQSKTAANVDVWLTRAAEARAADERRRMLAAGILPRGIFLRDPRTGAPWSEDPFRKRFAKVRARAAERVPGCAAKKFQDCRDTAVTRLALAEATIYQIMAVTGHSPQSINVIMKSYLALSSPMARAARDQLEGWLHREGIRL